MAEDIRGTVTAWAGKTLSDSSKLSDTKEAVNYAVGALTAIVQQSLLFSPVQLSSSSNWGTLDGNSTYYFDGLGIGAPDSSTLGTTKGLLWYISNDVTPLKIQLLIGDNGHVGLRFSLVDFTTEPWNFLGTDDQLQASAKQYVINQMANYDTSDTVTQKVSASATTIQEEFNTNQTSLQTQLNNYITNLSTYYTKSDIDSKLSSDNQIAQANFLTDAQRTQFDGIISAGDFS